MTRSRLKSKSFARRLVNMGILSKLKEIFLPPKKRKLVRDELQGFLKVNAAIDGTMYSIKDFSAGGFALIKTPGSKFEVGKTYSCIMTIRGQPRATIKAIARRIEGDLVGFQATENEIFERFVANNLRLGQKKV